MKKLLLSLLLIFVSLMLFACNNNGKGPDENNPPQPAENEDELFAAHVEELTAEKVINAASVVTSSFEMPINFEELDLATTEIHVKLVEDHRFDSAALQAAFEAAQAKKKEAAGENYDEEEYAPMTYVDNSVFIWTEKNAEEEKLVKAYTDLTGSFLASLLPTPEMGIQLNISQLMAMIKEAMPEDADPMDSAAALLEQYASIEIDFDEMMKGLSFIDEIKMDDFEVIEKGKYQVKQASLVKWFGEDTYPNVYIKSAQGIFMGIEVSDEDAQLVIDLKYNKEGKFNGVSGSMNINDGETVGNITFSADFGAVSYKVNAEIQGVKVDLELGKTSLKLTVKYEESFDIAIDLKVENNALKGTVKATVDFEGAAIKVDLKFDGKKIDGSIKASINTDYEEQSGNATAGVSLDNLVPDTYYDVEVTITSNATLPEAAKAADFEYQDAIEMLMEMLGFEEE